MTWFSGHDGLGWWLNLLILVIFSNISDSVTLEKHRNTEYLKLKGTHKDHLAQLMDLYRH